MALRLQGYEQGQDYEPQCWTDAGAERVARAVHCKVCAHYIHYLLICSLVQTTTIAHSSSATSVDHLLPFRNSALLVQHPRSYAAPVLVCCTRKIEVGFGAKVASKDTVLGQTATAATTATTAATVKVVAMTYELVGIKVGKQTTQHEQTQGIRKHQWWWWWCRSICGKERREGREEARKGGRDGRGRHSRTDRRKWRSMN